MARTRRPLIAGNWKMNGLKADALALARGVADGVKQAGWTDREVLVCPPATLVLAIAEPWQGSGLAGRRPGLPRQGERRPYRRHHRPRCCAMPAPATSSSAIPSGAPITARPTRSCGPRPRRRGGPGCCRSSVSARRWPSARPAGRWRCSRPSSRAACRPVRPRRSWSWPTSRSGRSAPARRRPPPKWPQPTRIFARCWAGWWPMRPRVRLLYGGSVKGSNAAELLAAGDVDGALVGGASLKADEFLAIAKAA